MFLILESIRDLSTLVVPHHAVECDLAVGTILRLHCLLCLIHIDGPLLDYDPRRLIVDQHHESKCLHWYVHYVSLYFVRSRSALHNKVRLLRTPCYYYNTGWI